MTCNAAAVRVNSLEAWDQSKQDWAPDQSSWQTQQPCCFAIVPLSLSLHFSSLSAEAWAIFSPGSSFPTAPNHNHPSLVLSLSLSLHNSSLHISLAWASILTSNLTQCTPWKICSDPPLSSFPYFAHSWCLKELGATGSAGKLRRCVGKEILFFLSLVLSNFPNKLSPDSPTPCLVSAWVLIFFPFFWFCFVLLFSFFDGLFGTELMTDLLIIAAGVPRPRLLCVERLLHWKRMMGWWALAEREDLSI